MYSTQYMLVAYGCLFSNCPGEGAHERQNPTFSNLLDFRLFIY
jgi:hypothetical protein